MKCPKCGYLGFDDVERCRNCGYDFSLALSDFVPELQLRRGDETPNPLDDLSLIDAAAAPAPAVPMADARPDLDRAPFAPETPARRSGGELPLFGAPTPDDQPLITRASPPRPPLAVRRATPEIPRLRGEQPRPQPLDLSLDVDLPAAADEEVFTPAARATVQLWPSPLPDPPVNAAVSARFVAVLIDLSILALIDLVVVYFTMQICGLSIADLAILPKGPLITFLLVQNGGYLVTFTAGGQTLGKMATGIRVVPTESAGSLDIGRAMTRTVVWVLLAVPAGLGFITLLGRDHRGLHDRFAGTRVIRASA